MKMKRMRAAALPLAAIGMALCLTGCSIRINRGIFGLPGVSYSNAEKYMVGAAELSESVENIEIDWLAGNVTMEPHDSDTVSFSEESRNELSDDTKLRYWLDGATLRIKFCRSGLWTLTGLKKNLTVLVPKNLKLTNLKVNSVSADIHLDTVRADSASINTTSGRIQLVDCAVTELAEINTVSGRLESTFAQPLNEFQASATSGAVRVSAPSITRFKAGTVSGAVSLSAKSAPEALEIETTSGDIALTLPEDASFTLDYDSVSGELSSDLPCQTHAGKYIFGDGKGEYAIDTVSGDVRITTAE